MDGHNMVDVVHLSGTGVNEVERPVTEGTLGEPVGEMRQHPAPVYNSARIDEVPAQQLAEGWVIARRDNSDLG
jgi:hypothetical protein